MLPGINPVSFVAEKPPCRYEAVNMGMVDQCPRPGVKDGKHADLPPHITGVGSQFHQRQGCGLHQEGIEDLLVRPDDLMGFSGDRKDGMVIGTRQALPPPFFKPCLSIGFMTGGTASIFAGMIGIAQVIAVAALEEMTSPSFGGAI